MDYLYHSSYTNDDLDYDAPACGLGEVYRVKRPSFLNFNLQPKPNSKLEELGHRLATGFKHRASGVWPKQPDYAHKLEQNLALLVSSLYVMVTEGRDYLVLTRNKNDYDSKSRHKPEHVSYTRVSKMLHELVLHQFIETTPGSYLEGKATTVRVPDGFLMNELRGLGDPQDNLVLIEDYEPIMLKDRLTASELRTKHMGRYVKPRWINYDDTPATQRYRQEVRRLKDFLVSADRSYLGVYPGLPMLTRKFYNGRWDCGGRVYGDPMQGIPKTERHHVLLDGEPIVDLDHSAMHVRLLYAHAGMPLPDGDPYAIQGLPRKGTKKAVVAILNCPEVPSRFPRGIKDSFPQGTKWPDVVAAIRSKLPLVLDPAFMGKGGFWQRLESNILVDCLLDLTAAGIPYIGYHDGIACPISKEAYVSQVMRDVFHSHVHADSHVTSKVYH